MEPAVARLQPDSCGLIRLDFRVADDRVEEDLRSWAMAESNVSIAIGRVEIVDVRAAWSNEPLVVTPWLAEPDNLSYYIGIPLGLDLEVVALENRVGPFSADIARLLPRNLQPLSHRRTGALSSVQLRRIGQDAHFHIFAVGLREFRTSGLVLLECEPIHFRSFGQQPILEIPHIGLCQVFVFTNEDNLRFDARWRPVSGFVTAVPESPATSVT